MAENCDEKTSPNGTGNEFEPLIAIICIARQTQKYLGDKLTYQDGCRGNYRYSPLGVPEVPKLRVTLTD